MGLGLIIQNRNTEQPSANSHGSYGFQPIMTLCLNPQDAEANIYSFIQYSLSTF